LRKAAKVSRAMQRWSWCCVVQSEDTPYEVQRCFGVTDSSTQGEAGRGGLGLPDDFLIVDPDAENARIEFAVLEPLPNAAPPAETCDSGAKAEPLKAREPLPSPPKLLSARIPGPGAIADTAPTLLPRLGCERLKADANANEVETKAGLGLLSTRSRLTASTASFDSEFESDVDRQPRPGLNQQWSGSSTSVCSMGQSVVGELEDQPTFLYPWEVDAMMTQAGASTSCPSSPRLSRMGSGATCDPLQQPSRRDAKMFYVEIDRRGASDGELGRLGLDTRPLLSDVTAALSVERVQPGGLVDAWNQACASAARQATSAPSAAEGERRHRIRRGDFIVEVNGIRGSSEGMYKVIAQEPSLRLLMMRLPGLHRTSRSGRSRRNRSERRQSAGGSIVDNN